MYRESISVKNFIGLKSQMFSPANLSTSMVSDGITVTAILEYIIIYYLMEDSISELVTMYLAILQ